MRTLSEYIKLRQIGFLMILTLGIFFANSLKAQITAPGAVGQFKTEYLNPRDTLPDPIFIFTDDDDSDSDITLTFTVIPDTNTISWSVEWYKYDDVAKEFSTTPVKPKENNVPTSSISVLASGGYRAILASENSSSVFDTSQYTAWAYNNYNNTAISVEKQNCEGVLLADTVYKANSFTYYTVYDSTEIKEVLVSTEGIKDQFVWRRDGKMLAAIDQQYEYTDTIFFTDGEAYEGEEDYTLTINDRFGSTWESNTIFNATTYVTKADFTIDPVSGQAPLEISFTNNSENATKYQWFIYNDTTRIEKGLLTVDDSLLTTIITDETPLNFIYENSGEYLIKLIVEETGESEFCIDEMILETPITVDSSFIEIPNVFTPNGDGFNDVFRVKTGSIRKFHATIFNRWGRVLYEWKNPEGGWDGKINGGMATPGTYFYVITASGREARSVKHSEKGAFMLIREK